MVVSVLSAAGLLLILILLPIPILIRARTSAYDFRGAFLYFTRGGVFFRSEKSYELIYLQGTEIARGPLDRLTGNGKLHLDFGEKHGKVVLRGLAPIAELRKTRDDLNEFARLLRSYPVLKGLIT